MSVEIVSKEDKGLAKTVQEWIDGFAKHAQNKLYQRVYESVLNLYRDGEDAIQLIVKPGEDYPRIRSVDTSWIRGPHNETTGPWSFGVLTQWPDDFDEALAYHIWKPDNSHVDVSPDVLKLAKLDTTGSNVKRGVPLAYKIRKQLPQLGNLLDCMAVGEAARQAIPYIQQYANADKQAVRDSLPSIFDDEPEVGGFNFRPGRDTRDEIRPGSIAHINKGQEYQAPPMGAVHQGRDAYQSLCEAVAAACNVPIWFAMGGSDKENYASAFVKESPLVKNIQHGQQMVTEHYKAICTSAIQIGIATGRLPVNSLDIVDAHCELPTPIARDKEKDIECDIKLADAGYLSPQHLCTRAGLDFEEETDLIKQAEAAGWKSAADKYAEIVSENGGMPDQEKPVARETKT